MKAHRYVDRDEVEKDFFKGIVIAGRFFVFLIKKAQQRMFKDELEKLKRIERDNNK